MIGAGVLQVTFDRTGSTRMSTLAAAASYDSVAATLTRSLCRPSGSWVPSGGSYVTAPAGAVPDGWMLALSWVSESGTRMVMGAGSSQTIRCVPFSTRMVVVVLDGS